MMSSRRVHSPKAIEILSLEIRKPRSQDLGFFFAEEWSLEAFEKLWGIHALQFFASLRGFKRFQ